MQFSDDKWPYAVGLLLTLASWHFAQLADEILSTPTLIYEPTTDPVSGDHSVTITNASKTASVSGLEFRLQCVDGFECLDIDSDSTEIVPIPPTFAAPTGTWLPTSIALSADIAPGGSVQISAKLLENATAPEFYVLRSSEEAVDVYLLDRSSWRAFAIEHYVHGLVISFAIVLLGLVFVVWRISRDKAGEGQARQIAIGDSMGSPKQSAVIRWDSSVFFGDRGDGKT